MGREREAVEDLLGVAVQRGATEEERAELRAAYARAGMRGFWRRWLDMDRRLSGPALDPLRAAYLHALAGEDSLALASLERAYAERNPGLIFLGMSRAFESLRANPGFARIVDGLRLPPAPAASSARPPTTGQPPRER